MIDERFDNEGQYLPHHLSCNIIVNKTILSYHLMLSREMLYKQYSLYSF